MHVEVCPAFHVVCQMSISNRSRDTTVPACRANAISRSNSLRVRLTSRPESQTRRALRSTRRSPTSSAVSARAARAVRRSTASIRACNSAMENGFTT